MCHSFMQEAILSQTWWTGTGKAITSGRWTQHHKTKWEFRWMAKAFESLLLWNARDYKGYQMISPSG